MFNFNDIDSSDKNDFYGQLLMYVQALTDGEHDLIANTANISSLLYNMMENVNWVGFYLYKEEQLVLGPFQGGVACIRIPLGKGVCGTAASTLVTQLVQDVHQFPGHIACDSATNSEIVVPITQHGQLIGVLDLDSPVLNRFDETDQKYLEQVVDILVERIQ